MIKGKRTPELDDGRLGVDDLDAPKREAGEELGRREEQALTAGREDENSLGLGDERVLLDAFELCMRAGSVAAGHTARSKRTS